MHLSTLAQKIRTLSAADAQFGKTLHIVGRSSKLRRALAKAARFSRADRPVLITGESGAGKELFAQSIYLMGRRGGKKFFTVNCAQYQNDELLVSELFGHKKGSFTGASFDRRGLFDRGDGGVVFLDEVGELSPIAQAMLLRVLGEGEIKPLGGTKARYVDVQVIAATNRSLLTMVTEKTFRNDLFYRLNCLSIRVPPVRERGNDWRLLVQFFLDRLNRSFETNKRLSPASWAMMKSFHWPGNVREIENVVELGYCLTEGDLIEPSAFQELIFPPEKSNGLEQASGKTVSRLYRRMVEEERNFWEVIRKPYLDRDLNRSQVKAVMKRGLRDSGGSYKRLLKVFGIQDNQYLKFMDFLRHHNLKPKKDELMGPDGF